MQLRVARLGRRSGLSDELELEELDELEELELEELSLPLSPPSPPPAAVGGTCCRAWRGWEVPGTDVIESESCRLARLRAECREARLVGSGES